MSSIKKTALIITIISLISKLFGFGREIVLAYFFGTTFVVDAYLMASSMPGIIFGGLSTFSVVFVPIYTDIRQNQGIEKSRQFTNNIISLIIALAAVCIFIGLVFNRQLVSLTAPGFKGEVFELTSQYLKISIWTLLFTAPINILVSYLNCNNSFIQSNISTFIISSVQIIAIVMSGLFNSILLIYGVLISNILQLIVLYIFSHKKDYRFNSNLSLTDDVKRAFVVVVPIFFSSMITQIGAFIDKSFASSLSEGSVAALNYGYIMYGFIISMFSVAITTMIYPMLSQSVAEKNTSKLKEIFIKGVNIIIILFVPITLGAIILAQPAISFVFERGEFGSSSTLMTTSAFIMYVIGVLAFALRDVIIKVFYSMQDTKPMLFISAIALALDIIFNIMLIKPMGHAGLALGTSLSAIITIPIFFIVLRKKIGALGLKSTVILFIKSCVSTLAMGVVVYFGYNWLSDILGGGKLNTLLSIILSAGVGGIIYFVLMIILKVKEMSFVTDILRKFFVK